MSFNDFMNKVRYWDNLTAKWMMRHFYFMFFQIVLVVIFVFWFVNTINVIDTSVQVSKSTVVERILMTQTVSLTVVVFLMLLNSFWMLYMFNGLQRMTSILKEVSFHISRLRIKNK